MEIFDVSVCIRPGMVVYEGDPPVSLERFATIGAGAPANLSRLDFGVHTGTHIDAPLHFFEDGSGAESVPLVLLVGPAHVVDATSVTGQLDAATLDRLGLPVGVERLLFKTANGRLWERESFSNEFVSFAADGAASLVERGVRLVGIDYLSVGDEAAHRILLGAGVIPLEGLDLRPVAPGPYELFCAPLKLEGSDGAPARVLLVRR